MCWQRQSRLGSVCTASCAASSPVYKVNNVVRCVWYTSSIATIMSAQAPCVCMLASAEPVCSIFARLHQSLLPPSMLSASGMCSLDSHPSQHTRQRAIHCPSHSPQPGTPCCSTPLPRCTPCSSWHPQHHTPVHVLAVCVQHQDIHP